MSTKTRIYSVKVDIGAERYCRVNVIPDELAQQFPAKYQEALTLLEEAKADPYIGGKAMIGGSVNTRIRSHLVDASHWQSFIEAYEAALDDAYRAHPETYCGPFNVTYNNMSFAILNGTYNKDSATFKAVCKKLGIKHTYKAINAFIFGESV